MALIEILRTNEELIFSLLKRGLISFSVTNKKLYYEFYLKECDLLKVKNTMYKSQAVTNTCEEFNISDRTVYNAISLMKS